VPNVVKVLSVGEADRIVGADGVGEDTSAALRRLDNAALYVEPEGPTGESDGCAALQNEAKRALGVVAGK
jgi:hypothetical protein